MAMRRITKRILGVVGVWDERVESVEREKVWLRNVQRSKYKVCEKCKAITRESAE